MNQTLSSGQQLLRAVRAGFVIQGTTMAGWCAKNDVDRPNARLALLGAWDGPKARALRQRLISAAGVR